MTTRTECVQCGREMASTVTNFCTVCCHNGLDNGLKDKHGYFQRERNPEPEFEYAEQPPKNQQSGLGEFQ